MHIFHYSRSFAPDLAQEQWSLFKEHMFSKAFDFSGFREYLVGYKGGMTPDTGPIIGGLAVAASGLAMKTAAYMDDKETFEALEKSSRPLLRLADGLGRVPGVNIVSAVATDLLASSIQFSALTKAQ